MKRHLTIQFHLLQAIRNFFLERGFMDVLTPPMVENPGMETHIHPFQIRSINSNHNLPAFLHTSPEFHMKELLSCGFEKTFTLSYCFRDEPRTEHHRSQFIMLEWYRAHQNYLSIMDDTEQLIPYCAAYLQEKKCEIRQEQFSFERLTISEVFKEYLNVEILNFLDSQELRKLIAMDFPEIHLPKDQLLSWDDYYFLLFLNKIEPKLINHPHLILYEYPAPLSALSTIKKSNPRVCERFELYINGVEIANCFNELTHLGEQKKRFSVQAIEKKDLYNYQLPEPTNFYNSLERGLPASSGIALGVERLLATLAKIETPFWD